jgi:hypothetical protein
VRDLADIDTRVRAETSSAARYRLADDTVELPGGRP